MFLCCPQQQLCCQRFIVLQTIKKRSDNHAAFESEGNFDSKTSDLSVWSPIVWLCECTRASTCTRESVPNEEICFSDKHFSTFCSDCQNLITISVSLTIQEGEILVLLLCLFESFVVSFALGFETFDIFGHKNTND